MMPYDIMVHQILKNYLVLSAAGSGIDNATNAILCHGNLCKPTAQIGTLFSVFN